MLVPGRLLLTTAAAYYTPTGRSPRTAYHSGRVLLYPSKFVVHEQKRNMLGLETSEADGKLTLRSLQSEASDVAPSHFRMLFMHLATGLPAMDLYANDDVLLTTVLPGGAATLDHIRLAPHAPGKIVKLQFRSVVGGLGSTSAAQSFDLSTRCDTAAYALILTGTGAREDRYDPMVFGVAGAAAACVLPSSPTAAGASSKVALLNTAPSAEQPAFQWGISLLTLTYQSGAMGLGQLLLLDLPVGSSSVYARLVQPAPPHAPLTVARAVDVLPQPRNALLAVALPSAASDHDGVTPQAWALLSAQEAAPAIADGSVRLLLLNGLGAGDANLTVDLNGGSVTLSSNGLDTLVGGGINSGMDSGMGMLSLKTLAANMSGVHMTCRVTGPNMTCPAAHTAAHWLDLPAADAPLASVALPWGAAEADGGSSEVGSSRLSVRLGDQLPGGACAQSLQLVALLGASHNTTPGAPLAFAPRLQHVDLSGGDCHLPSINIPPVVVPEPKVTPTPFPIANYDLTGLGAGAFEGLLGDDQESAAERARGGPHGGAHGGIGLLALGATVCWLLVGERRHSLAHAKGEAKCQSWS